MELEKEYDSICIYIHLDKLDSDLVKYKSTIHHLTLKTNKRLDIVIHCNEIIENLNDTTHLWKKWNEIEKLLSSFYVMTSQKTYQCGKILLDVNVIFDKWCDYEIFIEDTWDKLVVTDENDIEYIDNINNQRSILELPQIKYIYSEIPDSVITDEDSKFENKFVEQQTCFIETNDNEKECYPVVALGGTFDHLHNGHKILLTISAWIASKKVICGVSDDELLKNKKGAELLQSIYERCYNVQKFLHRVRRNLIYYIQPINDGYGPTIIDKNIQAIVGSLETLSGCHAVNSKRKQYEFPLLDIFSISLLAPKCKNLGLEDAKLKMSSSSIRLFLLENENENAKKKK